MLSSDRAKHELQLRRALEHRVAERSLLQFVEQAWPILEPATRFVPNWHLPYLCEHLEAVTAGEIRRLLITLPPRHMKSLIATVFWPMWEWLRYPGLRYIFVSYAEALAIKHSLDRRTVLQSPWYQALCHGRVRLAVDQNEKREFLNTQRGHMTATSMGGSVLGKGGNRIVVDDPHNPSQAESDTQREHARRYFRGTLSTRLDNKNTDAIIVVMQRLHEQDLGALCQDLGYHHVCLPAEAEVSTRIVFPRSGRIVTRPVGDVLWPARESAAVLAEQRQLLGSASYAAQYQQRPVPADGILFDPRWFRVYSDLPVTGEYIQSWDMSFKGESTSDFVVGFVAMRVGADLYVVDRVKGQWGFSETCRQVLALRQRYPRTSRTLIEDAANGTAIIDMLRHHVSGVTSVTPAGGKVARAQAAQPFLEAGNVYLPQAQGAA